MSNGVRHMMYATLFFALMNVCVKALGKIPAVEIVFFRSVLTLILCVLMLLWKKVPLLGNNKPLLTLRGLLGACALVLYFKLIQAIPLATATTILFMTPVFTAMLGTVLVREPVKWLQWLFFAISFAGVFIIEGFDASVAPFYVLIGILSSFFSGLAHNCIRKLNTGEHPLVIMLYFPLITLPITGAWSWFDWVTPAGYEWLLLFGVGIFAQAAQFSMTRAYQISPMAGVDSVRYLGILYSIAFGWFLFGERLSLPVLLGIAVTLIGIVLNMRYIRRQMYAGSRQTGN